MNETLMDLPFSYQFRMQGDRLIVGNCRVLLAGPNPLGKLGGLTTGDPVLAALTYFQALGTVVEGTYTTPDAKEKSWPKKLPMLKSRGPAEGKLHR